MFKLLRSSFSVKATALVIGLLSCAITATGLITYLRFDAEMNRTIKIRTDAQLRVASQLFVQFFPVASIEKGDRGQPVRIRGRVQSLKDMVISDYSPISLVDQIAIFTQGNASVFIYSPVLKDYVRIATTIKKTDGTLAIGTLLGADHVAFPSVSKGELFKGPANILGEQYQTGYMPIVNADGAQLGVLAIAVGKVSDLSATVHSLLIEIAIVCGAILLCSALIAIVVFKRFIKPIPRLVAITKDIASDKLIERIPFADRSDEIGQLAKSLAVLKEALVERNAFRQASQAQSALHVERQKQLETYVEDFQRAVSVSLGRVRAGSHSMQSTSSDLARVVNEAHDSTVSVRQAAEAAAINADSVAAASDQLSGSVGEIGARTDEAVRIVSHAARVSTSSGKLVKELASASDRIGQVVNVIQAIAEQTNLLALNATIEAARAGDAGRGFAVVASEVKGLAGQTGAATREIASHITSIQTITADVVEAFEQIETGLDSINNVSLTIASAIEEQALATQNIAHSAVHAAQSASVMRDALNAIETAVDRTRGASSGLEEWAGDFSGEADRLVAAVDAFLVRVAA